MFLGVEPSHLAGVKFHGYLAATGRDHSLEGRQCHHHAVRVCVNVRCVARSIEVLEDSHTVVLPHDTVESWVRDHGVGHVTKVHKRHGDALRIHGTTRQKRRIRVHCLLPLMSIDAGGTPHSGAVADAAEISRTTTYRCFQNQRALILSSDSGSRRASVLPSDVPTDDVAVRVDFVTPEQVPIVRTWEPHCGRR
jgi:hypothetical protein